MNRNRLTVVALATTLIAMMAPTTAFASATTESLPTVTTLEVATPVLESAAVAENVADTWVTATPWPSDYGSLSSIAAKLYGNAGLWGNIHKANPSISNPNVIQVGQRIFVPSLGSTSSAPAVAEQPLNTTNSSAASGWVHPVPGSATTSCYEPRWGTFHYGIDLAAGTGTPIRAVSAGRVTSSGWIYDGYGISVLLNNYVEGVWTHYAHMSKTIVSPGQWIAVGQTIGYVGSTGFSTGPHLHFEVWQRGYWGSGNPQINPASFMRDRGVSLGC